MNVDLNSLRKQAAFALDDVINTLNNGIMSEKAYGFCEIDGKTKTFHGDILVSTEDLQNDLYHLRQCIYSLLCVYSDDDPLFQCVFEDVESSGGLAHFNPKNEE